MLKLLLGDPNSRKLKRYQPLVSDINLLEEEVAPLSDDQLRGLTAEFRQKLENARSSGGSQAGDATAAAITGAMALMQQRQINYTRSNESEADRIGIQTLARAGYDPNGMADFFERMQRVNRGNSGGYQLPEYLRTHPVTTTRISETRQLANRLQGANTPAPVAAPVRASLLLPGELSLAAHGGAALDRDEIFPWARERLRVLSASSPRQALLEYQALAKAPGQQDNDALRYGLALAQQRAGRPREATATLDALLKSHPGDLWLELARAETAALHRPTAEATELFEALLQRRQGHALDLGELLRRGAERHGEFAAEGLAQSPDRDRADALEAVEQDALRERVGRDRLHPASQSARFSRARPGKAQRGARWFSPLPPRGHPSASRRPAHARSSPAPPRRTGRAIRRWSRPGRR